MTDQPQPERKLVRDLMSVGVQTCPPDMNVVELGRLFLEKNLEAVIVLDENGHAAGVVSLDDLIRAYAAGGYQAKTAEAIMEADVPTVPPEIPLATAAQIMLDKGARAVFMMHHAGGVIYPAAVLTYRHMLRHLAMKDDSELNDLGIKANRKAPLEQFIQRREEARRRNLNR
jgi:CBS domain-containing protein